MSKANFFKTKLYLFFIIGILLQTCIDPYEFTAAETDKILVIDGKITNNPTDPQTVRLTYTTQFGKTNNPPVTGATVELKDNQGQSAVLLETEEGVYTLAENSTIEGTIGNTYHIEITLPNGKRYASTPETMQPTPVIDSINYQFGAETITNEFGAIVTKNFIKISVGTPIISTEQGLFLRWDVENVYIRIEPAQPSNPFFSPKICFKHANTNPQDILLLDARNISTNRIDDNIVATKQIDKTFWDAHSFNVTQYSLTQNAYNYWSEIDKIANNVGGLFDTPPATVRGNIYNMDNESELVLGYFEAASSSILRTRVHRHDVPYTVEDPCRRFSNTPNECLNCLVIPGATLVRPPYW